MRALIKLIYKMSESLEIGVLFAIIILIFYILVAHFIEIH